MGLAREVHFIKNLSGLHVALPYCLGNPDGRMDLLYQKLYHIHMSHIIEKILNDETMRTKSDVTKLSLNEGEFEPWWS
ncbi:MAG: hypothetical protein KA028_00540 [Candidatus Pacebacteria bacterium]|nr:hypothetical protein [Candidatus Paceibacterota bacterium]